MPLLIIRQHTTELHPKVRPTCYQIFFPTITNKNSQHQIIPSGKNCECLVCRMGDSDQIFLFGTLFPDMVRKFWPYCGRFLLASKRNPRCVYGASLCSGGGLVAKDPIPGQLCTGEG